MNELKITHSHGTSTEVRVEDNNGPLKLFTFNGITMSRADERMLLDYYKQDPDQVVNVINSSVKEWIKRHFERIKV